MYVYTELEQLLYRIAETLEEESLHILLVEREHFTKKIFLQNAKSFVLVGMVKFRRWPSNRNAFSPNFPTILWYGMHCNYGFQDWYMYIYNVMARNIILLHWVP